MQEDSGDIESGPLGGTVSTAQTPHCSTGDVLFVVGTPEDVMLNSVGGVGDGSMPPALDSIPNTVSPPLAISPPRSASVSFNSEAPQRCNLSFYSITSLPWDRSAEAGVPSMTKEEAQQTYDHIASTHAPWLWRGVLMGPLVYAWLGLVVGRLDARCSLEGYAAWTGAVSGVLLHAFACMEAGYLVYIYVAPLPYLISLMGLYTLCFGGSVLVFVYARNVSLPMDPGPVDQIYGIPTREHIATHEPPNGTVTAEECLAVFDSITMRKNVYKAAASVWGLLAVALFYVCVFGLRVSPGLLAAYPVVVMGGFYVTRVVCFCHIDRTLTTANRSTHLLRGNLAWVLRRSRFTLFSTLWLVRRVPLAHNLVANNAWQGPSFARCDPEFKRLVKLVLLSSRRNRDVVGKGGGGGGGGADNALSAVKYLPQELALNVLGFLATPDIMTEKHLMKAKSFRATIG